MEKLSVVVTCYNKQDTILKCLENFLKGNPVKCEVIVVDDGSTDGSSEILNTLSRSGQIKLVKTSRLGPAAARNAGFKEAEGDLILFVDGDCVVEEESLEELLETFRSNSELACVGGDVYSLNSESRIARAIELMQSRVNRPWPFGACVAYRREALERVGGFEESMPVGEDAELYFRVKKLGYQCQVLNPKVKAYTVNPSSISQFLRQRLRWGTGFARLTERHPEAFTPKLKMCFLATGAMLFSPLILLLDPHFYPIPLALFAVNFLWRLVNAVRAVRGRGKALYIPLVALLKFLNVTSYMLGFLGWKLLKAFKGKAS